MREIDCYECDGKGWEAVPGENNLPIQETCYLCKGKKKITVNNEFAQYLLGEVRGNG